MVNLVVNRVQRERDFLDVLYDQFELDHGVQFERCKIHKTSQEQFACPFNFILHIQINLVAVLAEDKLGVVKQSGHEEVKQVAAGGVEHLVHPLGRNE